MSALRWMRRGLAVIATVGVVGLTTYAIFLGCQSKPAPQAAPQNQCPAGYVFDGTRCTQQGQPGQGGPSEAPPPAGMELNF